MTPPDPTASGTNPFTQVPIEITISVGTRTPAGA